jgi:hypothetical protein
MEGGGPLSFLAPKIFFISTPLRYGGRWLPAPPLKQTEEWMAKGEGGFGWVGAGGSFRNCDVDRGSAVKTKLRPRHGQFPLVMGLKIRSTGHFNGLWPTVSLLKFPYCSSRERL